MPYKGVRASRTWPMLNKEFPTCVSDPSAVGLGWGGVAMRLGRVGVGVHSDIKYRPTHQRLRGGGHRRGSPGRHGGI